MIRRLLVGAGAGCSRIAVPVSAQLFGVVFDPTNYANAVLRYAPAAAAVRAARHDLPADPHPVPAAAAAGAAAAGQHDRAVSQSAPRRGCRSTAPSAYGTTTRWILTANTGHGAAAAYTRATQPLAAYAGALARLSADEAARVGRATTASQLADGSVTHGLEALGVLRGHQESVETTIRNLEDDTYADDPDLQHPDRRAQQDQRDRRDLGAAGQGHQQRAGLAPRAAAARGDRAPRSRRRRASTRTSRS